MILHEDKPSRDAQQRANRKLTWFHDEDGMLVIEARLPTEAGQRFIKALEAASARRRCLAVRHAGRPIV